jgi:DNA-binding NtrC family response regulator/tetratricopeptide (TPR) repeat protein
MFQAIFVRPLRAEERKALIAYTRSANGEQSRRARAILLSSQGKTAAQIGRELQLHPSNVKKWIKRFNEMGLEGIAVRKRGPHNGPKPKFTAQQIEKLLRLAACDPATLGYSFKRWTTKKLAAAAVERGIVERISHVTVGQILKRHSLKLEAKLGHSFRLGREAFEGADFERAAESLRAAVAEGFSSPEEEAVARCMLSRALEELSRFEESYEVIKKYEDPKSPLELSAATRAQVKLRIGWVNSWLQNYPKAIAAFNEAKKLFLELQDNRGISESYYGLGHTYIRINEFSIARDHLLAAIDFQKVPDRELLAKIYDRLGTADLYEGNFSGAKEHYLKALGFAEGSKNANLLGMILHNLGTTFDEAHLGERQQSAAYIRRSIEYLEKGGRRDFLILAYNNLGDALRYSGLWEEAIENLKRAVQIAQSFISADSITMAGVLSNEATARTTLAEILCAKGEFSEAEAQIEKSLALIENHPDKWLESNALRVLANVYQGKGQMGEALKALRQALHLSTSIGDLHGLTLAQVALAEIHFSQGRYDQAREYLELAQERLKEEKSLYISGLIQRLLGQIETALGLLAEAKQHISQSISIFATTEVPYEAACSHYQMGLLLKKAGDYEAARDHLLRAKEIFEKLGARPYIEAVRQVVAEMPRIAFERSAGIRARAATSDALLMQRLIEASASRELLFEELASVIYENFPAKAIAICRLREDSEPEVLIYKGMEAAEARRLCGQIGTSAARSGEVHVARLSDGPEPPLIIYVRASQRFDFDRLQPLLKQVELGLEACRLRVAARAAPATPKPEHRIHTVMPGFIVASPAMFEVLDKIHKIRTSDVTVLITGESGTGKELVARAIHAESARAQAAFLPFNCTATPKDLIDSQLFGYRRGAFTGATTNYPGIIRAAEGGTLFLDEIGDLALDVQPKLMRFLQEGEIQPLGETKPIKVDVRVIAATNTDLERAVEEGRFREDLFHRLNIIRIHIPPLRERREEIPVLAEHFLEQSASRSGKRNISLSSEAMEAFMRYDWPGNIRQLRNEIERAVTYASDGARILLKDLSPQISNTLNNSSKDSLRLNCTRPPMKLKEAVAELERRLIMESLARNSYNLSRTAAELGLSRRGLRLKLSQLGIEKES